MKITPTTPKNAAIAELGKRLAQVRKQQGFTQQQLASESGLGVATLRRIEDGKDAQLGSWIKLLEALDMSYAIDSLLPENFSSPMADAIKNRRGRPGTPGKASWGDEL